MIENDEQLKAGYEALGRLYRALAALRREILPVNPRQYARLAERLLEEINQHRADLGVYLGLNEAPPLGEPLPFTISTDDQLQGTYRALGLLYETLASMRRRVLPIKPRNYAVFAEGHIDEILKLQSEIDAYLGLSEPAPAPDAESANALHETQPPYDPLGST